MTRFILAAALILPLATSAVAAPEQKYAGEKAADPADKMICKKFMRTGSLVASYRACKTKRQWDIERDARKMYSVSDGCALRYNGENCVLP
jgi:uncharacterized membrane protein